MFSKKFQRRSALILFIAYSLDLIWKLANWHDFVDGLPWWGLALALSVRFAFMAGVLFLYLKLRRSPDGGQVVTAQIKRASVRSIQIIHRVLFAVIVMYIFLTEWLFKKEADVSAASVITFYVMAATMVAVFYVIRAKLLRSAGAAIERNHDDAEALGRWRAANILGMVGAVSVSMFGLALRAIGGTRLMVWPFLLAALVLIFILKPDDAALGPLAAGEPSQ
jgi:hypothetical protein